MVTTIISDIHLGSPACQLSLIEEFLHNLPEGTERLILNGDVLEGTEQRLTKRSWRILSKLRKLSDDLQLVWVRGNHDSDADGVAHLIGATYVEEFLFKSGLRNVLCTHGDQWDVFLTNHPIISRVADFFYNNLQRFSRSLAVRAKRRSKTFLRCAERIKKYAVQYGVAKGADVVICGHSHHAEASVAYYNSGSWTDAICNYLTVEDGNVFLHDFIDKPKEDDIVEYTN